MAMAELLKNLVLVKNEMKYFEFIRTLRNDPLLKDGFIDQKEITSEEHAIYMSKFHDAYFICLLEDQPVGYVGVVENDIRIAILTDFQNFGIGKFMVSEILKLFPESSAKVKFTNIASQGLFESLGFTKEFILYRNPLKP
jgi:ribosomal protein S18 acetylase RimI-like enzyme